MPFFIPSLGDLCTRLRAAFQAELPGADAYLWPNNINPTAKVVAGGLSELFGRLDYVNRQARVATAEGEWLDAHGAEVNLPRRPPAPAGGGITFTAQGPVTIADGALFLRSDGVAYVVSGTSSLAAAGTLALTALAVLPGGAGLAQPGTILTPSTGISGTGVAGSSAVVDVGGMVGGADTEIDGPPYTRDLGTYRGRILFRKAYTPMGGAPSDYVTWAASVPGVTRVYVERRYAGPGTVRVFPLFDDLFAAQGGVADYAHLALVQAAIDAQAPAACYAIAALPTPQVFNPTISGLVPNNSGVQQAVRAELLDTLRRLGAVAGSDPATPALQASMPFLATPQSFSQSWLWQAVANASGEQRHVLAAPSADIAVATAAVPVLGTVTFV